MVYFKKSAGKRIGRVPTPVLTVNDLLSTAGTLKGKFAQIFESKRFSDVNFLVGQEPYFQKVPAHKLVLSVGSEVFATMFSTIWVSEDNESEKVIEVPDIDPDTFIKMLRFLYMEEFSVTAECVGSLLYAANKYAILPLEQECVKFLLASCSTKNVFSTLKLAETYSLKILTDKCYQTISQNCCTITKSDQFLDLDSKTLAVILELDSLEINEIDLFRAVKKWSKAECARRDLDDKCENHQLVLKELLPLVRFPIMSVKDFSNEVAKSGLLHHDYVIDIFYYLTAQPKPPPLPSFNLKICKYRSNCNEESIRRKGFLFGDDSDDGSDESIIFN